MRITLWRHGGVVAALMCVLALVLAACAADPETVDAGDLDVDVDDDGDAEPTDDGDTETIRLVANPWPGSYANAHVAAQLMETELGLDVEVVEIDENAQWAGLDDGSLDAVLEVWPSGHLDNYETYIEELGTVVDIGELGAVGQIGWFLPAYLLEEHPEFETWEGLEGNEELFATAETGDAGQFLAADPSFVQFDEHIINNLGLNFEVVQSGSEAAQLTAVETALEREEPVLFYFYTPHWMHAQHDLAMVELPEWTEECEARPEEERDCGYPEDVLFKAASAQLEDKSSEAFAFLQEFRMENEWQDAMTYRMDVEGQSAEEAAEWWISEHEDVWQDWF